MSRYRLVVFSLLIAVACVLLRGDLLERAMTAESQPASGSNGLRKNVPAPADSHAVAKKQRMREGSQVLDRVGTIRPSGQRFLFHCPDDRLEIRLLENLALERVIHAQDEVGEDRLWSVSGVVTEYQGESFLLLTRAVAKSSPSSTTTTRASHPRAP